MTAPELADTARDICDAGAALLHLHVRDADGGHSLDADLYRQAIEAIRGEVGDDLVIQITTESVGVYEAAEQMEVVKALWPEAASCALRELCPADATINRYGDFLSECRARRTWVQHILYDGDDTQRFLRLWRDGVIPDREPFVLLVLGRYGERGSYSASDLVARTAPFLSDDAPAWAACAFGARETQTVIAAAALGGHVRVGFENNLEQPDGTQASSNAAQVARVVKALSTIGRPPVTATELRAALSSRGPW
jgi:uncharacterized protein (DUF849 family)